MVSNKVEIHGTGKGITTGTYSNVREIVFDENKLYVRLIDESVVNFVMKEPETLTRMVCTNGLINKKQETNTEPNESQITVAWRKLQEAKKVRDDALTVFDNALIECYKSEEEYKKELQLFTSNSKVVE